MKAKASPGVLIFTKKKLSATEQVEDFCPIIPQTLIELLMEKEDGTSEEDI
jgi:hypothetical protein